VPVIAGYDMAEQPTHGTRPFAYIRAAPEHRHGAVLPSINDHAEAGAIRPQLNDLGAAIAVDITDQPAEQRRVLTVLIRIDYGVFS